MFKSLFVLLSIPFLLIVISFLVVTLSLSKIFEKRQVNEKEEVLENDELSYCLSNN
ncbi:MAG: hypothetical protein JWR87_2482 [Segetibacter sp.]|jgi:hypothetical protein|nr:hypothetical protein [Segetibacter sp.]